MAVVIGVAVVTFLLGGATGLVWGMFVATVATWHVTFSINSLAHVWGTRRYATDDDSRNNALLAIAAFGEGWHNNHHQYQRSARHGFFWWEVDLTCYVLQLLEGVGLIWDVRGVPRHVRDQEGGPAHAPLIAAPVGAPPAPARRADDLVST